MTWKLINIDNPGSANVYGGNDILKIMKLLSGFDLKLDDDTDDVEIGTDTTVYNEKFSMLSPTTGFRYIWRTQDITADRYISLPLMDDDGEISLSSTTTANDYGDNMQTFRHNNIQFRNPANTFSYIWATSAIVANRTITLPLLTGNDTVVFANATQTLTNKTLTSPTISAMTINTDSNTIKHSTTNNSGDLLVNNGSKFDRLARGTANQVPVMNATGTAIIWIDQASLAVSGGGGGGGTTPGGVSNPTLTTSNFITGAWYGASISGGGAGVWAGFLGDTSNISPVPISDTTGRMGLRYNFTSDDDRGGFRTNTTHFSRQNDPELTVRWRYDPLSATHTSSTSYRVVVGFTSDPTADYGSDGALDSKSAFMWFKETADTDIQVGRNDGDANGDKETGVSLTQTNSSVHTIRLYGDSTNNRFGISLDGGTAVNYTTEIPASTTKLGCIVQFENEGSDDRSFEILGAYFKAKII